MSVRHKDPCPCGSGKKYKHCHLKKDLEKRQHGVWMLLGAVVVIGAAVLYFALGGGVPWGGGRAGAPAGTSLPVTTGAPPVTGTTTATGATTVASAASKDQSPLPGGGAPQPWQYDAPRNRFWHPDHAHWHDGPPPDPSQRTAATPTTSGTAPATAAVPPGAAGQPRATVTRLPDPVSNAMSKINQPAPVAVDQTPLPGGLMPTPNYYDAVKNRYWSAEHYHWHPGRPPAAATTTPAPPARNPAAAAAPPAPKP
jgi:hypothetical protein